jgi:hypothetical protein
MLKNLLTSPALIGLVIAMGADATELERHTVMADGHSVAVWEKSAPGATDRHRATKAAGSRPIAPFCWNANRHG